MGISIIGSEGLKDFRQTGFDTNASSNSNSFDIGELLNVVLQILDNSGTHTTHIIQMQCSIDDINWEDISGKIITGLGAILFTAIAAKFIRVRVSTVEGAASTVNIMMQVK